MLIEEEYKMPELLEQVYDSALQLNEADRGKLAARLIESLPADDGLREEWKIELTRRAEELRTGKVVGVTVESLVNRLRKQYP